MKIPVKFVACVILLGLIKDVVPINPDSEIVQDPTKDSTGAGTANARQIRNSESSPNVAVISHSYSGYRLVRPFYVTNLDSIWRELDTPYGNEGLKSGNQGDFVEVYRFSTNNRNVLPTGDRDTGPDSVDVASPSISMMPSNTDRGGSDGRTSIKGGGTLGNPSSDGGSRPFPGPSGQGNRGYRKGVRDPSRFRPDANDQNRAFPGRIGNQPQDRPFGRRTTTRPSGGNQAPPVPPKPQDASSGDSASNTNSKRISPDANMFAGIVNDFAFKLMDSLNRDSNFVISPLSIFVALSVCYLGAEGETKAQLEQVLGLNDYAVHGIHLHQGISDLLSMISPESDEFQLFFANGLFLGKNFNVEESFKEDTQKYYGAQLKNLDFGNQAYSLRVINEWVANNTRKTIESIVSEPLPIFTRLVLLNAIFFKGVWEMQFPREFTFDSTFFTLDGDERQVPFMNVFREKFKMFRSDEHRHSFIKLPYKGDQVSMIIALPYDHEEAPMPTVTDQILCHMRDAMIDMQTGIVSIPKFRLEYLASLNEPLKNLGIKDIFGSSVNMSKMRKQNDVYVSNILHKAVVDVNEEGTTAAATTALQAVPYSSAARNDFEANHPFAFYIVHEASGLVLFYGKIFDIGEGARAPPSNGRGNDQVPPSDSRNSPRVPSDNGRDNAQVPPDNGRDNAQMPSDNGRDNAQMPSDNGRDNAQMPSDNGRDNAQVPPDNERDNIPSHIRNIPQVPTGRGRPQDLSYRRESPHVRPSNRG